MKTQFLKQTLESGSNIKDSYLALSASEQQSLLGELQSERPYDSIITKARADSHDEFYLSGQETFLGQLTSGTMPEEGAVKVLQFELDGGLKHSYEIHNKDGKIFFHDKLGNVKELKETADGSKVYTYHSDGQIDLFDQLAKDFQSYVENNASLEQLIKLGNLDAILKRWSTLSQASAAEVCRLTYHEVDQSGNQRYGTFMHKAVEILTTEQLKKIFEQLKKDNSLMEYTNLTDEQGRTIFDLASLPHHLTKENKAVIHNFDPFYIKPEVIRGGVNTHLQSVNITSAASLIRLVRDFVNDKVLFGLDENPFKNIQRNTTTITLDRSRKNAVRFNNAVQRELKDLLRELEYFKENDKDFLSYIKFSLDQSEKAKPITDPAIAKKINAYRFYIKTAHAMIDDVVNSHRTRREDDNTYPFSTNSTEASGLSSCGLTYEELIAVTYYAAKDIRRHHNYASLTPDQESGYRVATLFKFFMHLYEIRRGVNISLGYDNTDTYLINQRIPDQAICGNGTHNKLAEALNTIHRAVEIVILTPTTIRAEFQKLMVAKLIQNADSMNLAQLLLWKKKGIVPEELKTMLISQKDNLIISVSPKAVEFFSLPQLEKYFTEALEKFKIPQPLEKMAERKLAQASKEELKTLLELEAFPTLMLTTEGYVHKAEYIKKNYPQLYQEILTENPKLLISTDLPSDLVHVSLETLVELFRTGKVDLSCTLLDCFKGLELLLALGHDLTKVRIGDTENNALVMHAGMGNIDLVRYLLNKGVDLNSLNMDSDTALESAAMHGHLDVISELLNWYTDPEAKEKACSKALIKAAGAGHEGVVELLIKEAPNLEAQDSNGYTALMLAAYFGKLAILEKLLTCYKNPETKKEACGLALIVAFQEGHEGVVELLIKEDPNLEVRDLNEYTALMLAADGDRLTILEKLLDCYKNPETKKEACGQALIAAVLRGHEGVVERLIKEDPNLEAKDTDGYIALVRAAYLGNLAILKKLLACYKNPETKKEACGQALIKAVQEGHEGVVELLIKEDPNLEVRDLNEYTALMLAADGDRLTILEKLLDCYKNPETKKEACSQALIVAAKAGQEAIVDRLLEEPHDLEAQDKNGYTALMMASFKGKLATVEKLLNCYNNPEAKEDACSEALIKAVIAGQEAIVDRLIREEINLDKKDKDGESVLMIAARAGHKAILEKLLTLYSDQEDREEAYDEALIAAAANGHKEIVEMLLACFEQDSEAKKHAINEALIEAVEEDHEEIVDRLLREGPDLEYQGGYNYRKALASAAFCHQLEILEKLLDHYKKNYSEDIVKQACSEALIAATQVDTEADNEVDNEKIVDRLLREDPNLETTDGENTALSSAGANGDLQTVEKLLTCYKNKYPENIIKQACSEALIAAATAGHEEIVDRLLREDPNLEAKDRFGRTALMLTSTTDHLEMVEKILTCYKEKYSETILEQACSAALAAALYEGKLAIVEKLLTCYTHPETKKKAASQALISITRKLQFWSEDALIPLIGCLLTNGNADVNAVDDEGKTTLDHAIAKNCTKLRDLLIEKGAQQSNNLKRKAEEEVTLTAKEHRVKPSSGAGAAASGEDRTKKRNGPAEEGVTRTAKERRVEPSSGDGAAASGKDDGDRAKKSTYWGTRVAPRRNDQVAGAEAGAAERNPVVSGAEAGAAEQQDAEQAKAEKNWTKRARTTGESRRSPGRE